MKSQHVSFYLKKNKSKCCCWPWSLWGTLVCHFIFVICFISLKEPSMLSCCLCVLCLSWRDQTSIFRGEETYCCLFARSYHLSLAKSEHTSTKIQYTAKIPLLYTWLNTFYLMSFVLFEDKFWLLVVYHPNKSDPINGQFRIQRKLFQHKMLSRTVSLSLLSTVNLWERRTIDNFWLCLAHPFLSSIQT